MVKHVKFNAVLSGHDMKFIKCFYIKNGSLKNTLNNLILIRDYNLKKQIIFHIIFRIKILLNNLSNHFFLYFLIKFKFKKK